MKEQKHKVIKIEKETWRRLMLFKYSSGIRFNNVSDIIEFLINFYENRQTSGDGYER